jgi:hypothetical protein
MEPSEFLPAQEAVMADIRQKRKNYLLDASNISRGQFFVV